MSNPEAAQLSFLTPFLRVKKSIYGGVYNHKFTLLLDSLRDSSSALYRPRDPACLTKDEVENAATWNGKFLFLGHSFNMYGHFLLETLPMLSYLLDQKIRRGVFLPWQEDNSLTYEFMDLLNIDKDQVFIYSQNRIVCADFVVKPRPFIINTHTLKDLSPYRKVLERIHNMQLSICSSLKGLKKVFLSREANRIPLEVSKSVESLFQKKGFTIIRPESLTIKEQIYVSKSASVIAGFSGSQLHNSIFASKNTLVIEIGDEYRKTINPNQYISNRISGSVSKFIAYKNNDLKWYESQIVDV